MPERLRGELLTIRTNPASFTFFLPLSHIFFLAEQTAPALYVYVSPVEIDLRHVKSICFRVIQRRRD